MEIFIPRNPYERFMIQPESYQEFQGVSNGIREVDDWEEVRTILRRWKEEEEKRTILRRWKEEAEEFRRWKEDPAQQEEMPCFFCKIGSCFRVSCEGKKKKIQIANEREKMNLMVERSSGEEKVSYQPPLAPPRGEDDEEVSSVIYESECESGMNCSNVLKKSHHGSSCTPPPPPYLFTPHPPLSSSSLSPPPEGYKYGRGGAMLNEGGEAVGNPNQGVQAIRNPKTSLLPSKCANKSLSPPSYPPEELSDGSGDASNHSGV